MTRKWSMPALILALVTACERPAAEQAVSSPKQTPSREVEFEAAAAVLAQVQAAYQAAPSVDVAAQTILTLGGNEVQREDLFEIGPGTSFRWQAPGVAMEVFGGRLMAEMDAVPDRVVDVPIEETVVKTAEQVLGEIARPPAFLLLRCGGSVGRWLESMTFGLIGTPRPAGTHAGDDGALVVVIEGTRGAGRLVIDSATMLVIQVEATARPNSAGGGGSSMVTDFDTRIGASAETRSAHIEPGHRMVVSTIDALTRTMTKRERLDVGDAVPDFTLPSTSGGEVTLSDLRGSVVVLDFWARWCAPCRAGLPGIQRLYDATGRNEAGVLVYGLNVQDGGNLKGVTEFWSKEKFRFPSLVSDSLEINRQWGIDGIPVTIVIAPDGTVLERVDGYTKGEWKHLAERAQAAQQP